MGQYSEFAISGIDTFVSSIKGCYGQGDRSFLNLGEKSYDGSQPINHVRQVVNELTNLKKAAIELYQEENGETINLTPPLQAFLMERYAKAIAALDALYDDVHAGGNYEDYEEVKKACETLFPEPKGRDNCTLKQSLQEEMTALSARFRQENAERKDLLSDEQVKETISELTSGIDAEHRPVPSRGPQHLPVDSVIPASIQSTGSLKDLAQFYILNSGILKESEEEYLKSRIRNLYYLSKVSEAKQTQPKKLTQITVAPDGQGILMPNLSLYQKQTSNNGCWSCSYQLLLQSRGVFLDQKDIRSYRPDIGVEGLGPVSGMEMNGLNRDTFNSISEFPDLMTDVLPNTAMVHQEFNLSETADDAQKETMKLQFQNAIADALYENHSPVSVSNGGHFITVVGMDEVGNFLVKDSTDANPNFTNVMTTDDVFRYCLQYGQYGLSLTYLKDLAPEEPLPEWTGAKYTDGRLDVSGCPEGVQAPPSVGMVKGHPFQRKLDTGSELYSHTETVYLPPRMVNLPPMAEQQPGDDKTRLAVPGQVQRTPTVFVGSDPARNDAFYNQLLQPGKTVPLGTAGVEGEMRPVSGAQKEDGLLYFSDDDPDLLGESGERGVLHSPFAEERRTEAKRSPLPEEYMGRNSAPADLFPSENDPLEKEEPIHMEEKPEAKKPPESEKKPIEVKPAEKEAPKQEPPRQPLPPIEKTFRGYYTRRTDDSGNVSRVFTFNKPFGGPESVTLDGQKGRLFKPNSFRPEEEIAALMARMEEKYPTLKGYLKLNPFPPAVYQAANADAGTKEGRGIINSAQNFANLLGGHFSMNNLLNPNMTPYLDRLVYPDMAKNFALTPEQQQELLRLPEFAAAAPELCQEMSAILDRVTSCIMSRAPMESDTSRVPEAMENVAELLGVPGLVAKTRRVPVKSGDRVEFATFVEEAEGKNIYDRKESNIFLDEARNPLMEKDALRMLSDMNILDYIVGAQKYGLEDLAFKTDDPSDPKKITGIVRKDPGLCFSLQERVVAEWTFGPRADELRVISVSMAKKVSALTKESLKAAIAGKGLTEEQMNACWGRVEKLQDMLRNPMHEVEVEMKDGSKQMVTVPQIQVVKGDDFSPYTGSFENVKKLFVSPERLASDKSLNPSVNAAGADYSVNLFLRAYNVREEAKTHTIAWDRDGLDVFAESYVTFDGKVVSPKASELNFDTLVSRFREIDPPLLHSSPEFRNMKDAMKDVQKLTVQVNKEGYSPDSRAVHALQDKMAEVRDWATKYLEKKDPSKLGKHYGRDRLEFVKLVQGFSDNVCRQLEEQERSIHEAMNPQATAFRQKQNENFARSVEKAQRFEGIQNAAKNQILDPDVLKQRTEAMKNKWLEDLRQVHTYPEQLRVYGFSMSPRLVFLENRVEQNRPLKAGELEAVRECIAADCVYEQVLAEYKAGGGKPGPLYQRFEKEMKGFNDPTHNLIPMAQEIMKNPVFLRQTENLGPDSLSYFLLNDGAAGLNQSMAKAAQNAKEQPKPEKAPENQPPVVPGP